MLHIHLLGTAKITTSRDTTIDPSAEFQFPLVLHLGMHPGRIFTQEEIVDLLRPEDPARKPPVVRQLCYRLRSKHGIDVRRPDKKTFSLSADQVITDLAAIMDPAWLERADAAEVERATRILHGYTPALSSVHTRWLDTLRADTYQYTRRAKAAASVTASTPPVPSAVARWVPPFVGRESEMRRIVPVLDQALAGGGGRVCHVMGAEGIGVSQLLAEIAAVAKPRRFRTITVTLALSDLLQPLALLTHLVPRLLALPAAGGSTQETLDILRPMTTKPRRAPDAGNARDPGRVRRRLRDAVIDLLDAVADERPLLLMIDHAHHLDDASRALLEDVTARMRTCRIIWIFGMRHLPSPSSPGAPDVALHIPLHGLAAQATHAIVGDFLRHSCQPGDADAALGGWCHTISGGNPRHIHSLLLAWAQQGHTDGIPHAQDGLIRDRLAHLSPGARDFLLACAVLEEQVSPAHLEAAFGFEAAVVVALLKELERDALLSVLPDQPFVVHELVTREIFATCSPAELEARHRQAAVAFERLTTESWAPDLAWKAAIHFIRVGEHDRAGHLVRECVRRLCALGYPDEAAKLLARLLEKSLQEPERLAVTLEYGLTLAYAGDWPGVERAMQAALVPEHTTAFTSGASGPRRVTPPGGVRMAERDTRYAMEILRIRAAFHLYHHLAAALDAAEALMHAPGIRLDRHFEAASLAAVIADTLCRPDRIAAIRAALRPAGPGRANLHRRIVEATLAQSQGEFTQAHRLLEETITALEKSGAVAPAVRLRTLASIPLRASGRREEALATLHTAHDRASAHGLAAYGAASADRIGSLYFDLRDFVRSHEWTTLAAEWQEPGYDQINDRGIFYARLRLAYHGGVGTVTDDEVAAFHASTLLEEASRPRVNHLAALVYWYLALGDMTAVRALLALLERELDVRTPSTGWDYAVSAYAAGLRACGEAGRAAEIMETYLRIGRREAAEVPWYLDTYVIPAQ